MRAELWEKPLTFAQGKPEGRNPSIFERPGIRHAQGSQNRETPHLERPAKAWHARQPKQRNPSLGAAGESFVDQAAKTEKPLTLRVQVRGSMCSRALFD